ncbi:hypothetical protein GF406_07320 [candidate division KSB1 bacterium]|nr:hypothetical protein [candidate division KSB1 bacterium]
MPKLTYSASSQVGFATGFLYLAVPESEDDFNLGYAVITVGDTQKSITFGSGLPLSSNTDRNLVLMLGGEVQLSHRAKFISENWMITGEDVTAVFSGGIRFFGEKLAVDLALITFEEALESPFPLMPWVDFSVFFGD